MDAILNVFLNNLTVGKLWLDDKRRFVFQYDERWLATPRPLPLSLSLPLRSKLYDDDTARAFFANLLPEAYIRQAVARKLGLSEQNDFALIWSLGGECAGAVSLLPEGESPATGTEYLPLDENGLHEMLASLPNRPLLAGDEGMRLSLAGAQNKLPVYIKDGVIHLPKSGPSSHIIKPPIRDLESTPENEAFCMMLAKRMGLSVPAVSLHKGVDDFFVIERYDRVVDAEGSMERVHQEDFCQAMGIPPGHKYESEGGPSLKRCFDLLKERSITPAADIKVLIRWVAFNYIIGNADAHAKNIALIFTETGPKLAPFYDLLCTAVYDGLTDKMAMRIGGENRPDWTLSRHWDRLSQDIGVKPKMVVSVLTSMAESIIPASDEVGRSFQDTYGENKIIKKIQDVILKRSRAVLARPL
jgi:serine/threonine-protein kinase HipA